VASDVDRKRQRQFGRVGGLTAWALNDAETMVGPAHRGFQARFERLVDPDGRLDPTERAIRADRARIAHMLNLAAKSAESRRKRKAGPDRNSGPAVEVRRAQDDERPNST
jgi:hypothetical protein